MPFFEPTGETDVDSLGRKKVPPPVAKKPRGSGAYDTEDSLLNSHTGVVGIFDIVSCIFLYCIVLCLVFKLYKQQTSPLHV
jgi:hypothetical protein